MLLVQAIYEKNQIQLKHIWLEIPHHNNKVFALKSTSSKRTVHFYVFGDELDISDKL